MVMPRETVCMGAPRPYEGARPEVMSSNAGWYIGYRDTDGGPYSGRPNTSRRPPLRQRP